MAVGAALDAGTSALDIEVAVEVEGARAQEYLLLAGLLARAPEGEFLARLAGLGGDETPLGLAHAALGRAAAQSDAEAVRREYFDLFVGVGRGEVLPYASYYLTGFLNERPLLAVRRDLGALGLARAEGLHNPEDHIAILADIMAALAVQDPQPARSGVPDQRTFFARHLQPWAGRFFEDLTKAGKARFYRAVGHLGTTFIAIETDAFVLERAASPGQTEPEGRHLDPRS